MNQQNLLITHAYYLISEGIILYLVALPFMYLYYQDVSWWNYFAILLGIGVVFSIFAKLTKNHTPYILSIPVLLLVFFSIGYPIGLCLVFAGVLAWRYIAIRSKIFLGFEAGYLSATILLTLIGLLIAKDFRLVLIPLVQIMTIMIGHTLSNLVQIKPEERKEFNRTVWLKWLGSFALLSVIFYLLSDIWTSFANWAWGLVGKSFTFLVTVVVNMFDFLHFNQFISSNSGNEAPEVELGPQPEGNFSTLEGAPSDGNLDAFILIIIGILVFFFVFAVYKAMKSKVHEKDHSSSAVYQKSEEKLDVRKKPNRFIRRKKVKINHPVRKLMYQFERKAAKLELGRRYHESIEDWFRRIGIYGDTAIYQKVRYGEQDVSTTEQEQIKETLRQLESKLSTQKEI